MWYPTNCQESLGAPLKPTKTTDTHNSINNNFITTYDNFKYIQLRDTFNYILKYDVWGPNVTIKWLWFYFACTFEIRTL